MHGCRGEGRGEKERRGKGNIYDIQNMQLN
jgi:hypothetical protein